MDCVSDQLAQLLLDDLRKYYRISRRVALICSRILSVVTVRPMRGLRWKVEVVESAECGKSTQDVLFVGARALALFVRSARRWTAAPLSEEAVRKFREKLAKSSVEADKVVCHGSYLINLGAPSPDVLNKSRVSMVDEMTRCQRLGTFLRF